MAATTKSNVELTEAMYGAFNRGDIDTVLNGMADDITWVEPDGDPLARSGTHHGPAAVVSEVFAPLHETCEQLTVTPKRYIDAGEIVVVEGVATGKTQSGESFEIPFAHICEIQDGLLQRLTNYMDTALWQQTLEA